MSEIEELADTFFKVLEKQRLKVKELEEKVTRYSKINEIDTKDYANLLNENVKLKEYVETLENETLRDNLILNLKKYYEDIILEYKNKNGLLSCYNRKIEHMLGEIEEICLRNNCVDNNGFCEATVKILNIIRGAND